MDKKEKIQKISKKVIVISIVCALAIGSISGIIIGNIVEPLDNAHESTCIIPS